MRSPFFRLIAALTLLAAVWAARAGARQAPPPDPITLSIVGTTDLHGYVFPRDGRGGVAILGGYVNNLRAARAADGGAVLLIDAGDTYQGAVESNLSEGAVVVDAYNALGYTAAAIGNHEFDFGALDSFAIAPRAEASDDPRGALKAIAARARFPLLAANLVDEATGRVVDWPNVRPSVVVEAAGVKVGIVGVMTFEALRLTLVVNTRGLTVRPLAETIAAEAAALRAGGADLVVVASHAGGRCEKFDDPGDLSSCDPSSEIFQVARQLPPGLVDAIVAGHQHAGLAHQVAGIPIVEAFSAGRAFGRVDLTVDRRTKRVTGARLFPPRELCVDELPGTGSCDPAARRTAVFVPSMYEGRPVVADPAIAAAMEPSLRKVRDLQAIPLGPVVETAIRRIADPESPLGNLFADAMRGAMPGADVALTNSNAAGGLRSDLRAGPLTFGALYDIFPFDNRLVDLTLTGAQLAHVFAEELRRGRRGALGVSGVRVRTGCHLNGVQVEIRREAGQAVEPHERLKVVTTDFLAGGAVFAPVAPPGGFHVSAAAPIVIDAVSRWIRQQARLSEEQFIDRANGRWEFPGGASGCLVQ